MEDLLRHTRALLLLQIHVVQEAAAARGTGSAPKVELLLADAGFAHREIASMLGKSVVAVAKAVSRGRAARRTIIGDATTANSETGDRADE
jgi:DNA-directed RNA polymerase specialized sigma24 family protein